ncbi:hypothetical protein PENTCL1PPCAC_252, partial [Pristionchus entomophagus]
QERLSSMVNLEYLRTLPGLINLVQVALGFAALFASCFIWVDTNVYIQLIYAGYGWQTLIIFILFVNWLINISTLLSSILGRPILEGFPKIRVLILYGICLLALILSAALESWYCNLSVGHAIFNPRFITVCIFNWLLVVSYVGLLIVTLLFTQ